MYQVGLKKTNVFTCSVSPTLLILDISLRLVQNGKIPTAKSEPLHQMLWVISRVTGPRSRGMCGGGSDK